MSAGSIPMEIASCSKVRKDFKKTKGGRGVKIGQFSTKKSIGLKHLKSSKKYPKANFFHFSGVEVFSPEMNNSASKHSRTAILELLADPYHTEFFSLHVDHF